MDRPPAILDVGSGSVKAGIAGEDVPRASLRNCVGRPKHALSMLGGPEAAATFCGAAADAQLGLLRLSYPVERGAVRDWDEMETVWRHVYASVLRSAPSAQPLLMTEAPLNPQRNRERIAEALFESCGVPGLMLCTPANLALYATGRTTGICFDVGEGVTSAVPIVNGFALPYATTRTDVGGRDVTDCLQALLRRAPLPHMERGLGGSGLGGGGDVSASYRHQLACRPRSFHTSSECVLLLSFCRFVHTSAACAAKRARACRVTRAGRCPLPLTLAARSIALPRPRPQVRARAARERDGVFRRVRL